MVFKFILAIDGWDMTLMKFLPGECLWTSLMISQHWFRQWLGAIRQQAITWANDDLDLCRHMASLDSNELINSGLGGNSVSSVHCTAELYVIEVWVVEWLSEWVSERVSAWVSGWMSGWVSECTCLCIIHVKGKHNTCESHHMDACVIMHSTLIGLLTCHVIQHDSCFFEANV